jgi:hypothetical protein
MHLLFLFKYLHDPYGLNTQFHVRKKIKESIAYSLFSEYAMPLINASTDVMVELMQFMFLTNNYIKIITFTFTIEMRPWKGRVKGTVQRDGSGRN